MLDYMTHQVLVYQTSSGSTDGEILKQSLMEELTLHIYSYPGKRHCLGEEEWSEFLLGFHGKLHDILLNFRYRGPSFWGYLNKVLEWQLLSFFRDSVRSRQNQWVCERESILEYSREEESQCTCLSHKIICLLESAQLTDYRTDALRSRLLLLVLKNVAFIPEKEYSSLFPLLGPTLREGEEYRDFLLEKMKRKYERKRTLESKRCENYCKLTLTEKKRSEETDAELICYLDEKAHLYRKRLKSLDRQIRSIPLFPSNEDISGVVNQPKGSVDSGLFYLRNFLESFDKPVFQ
ncbi:MAG: hypothetical protein PQJ58_14495 [Spirochaetales bacterium]|nr:hypothetical protein [Spirochaetales bacterium]